MGKKYKVDTDKGSYIVETDEPEEAAKPSLMQSVQSYLPSAQTAARVGGGLIGGAIGGAGGTIAGTPIGGVAGATMGGAAGASIGDSLYQLAKRYIAPNLSGQPLPQSSGQAAMQQAGALTSGALQEGPSALINRYAAPALEKSASKQIARSVQPSTYGQAENVKNVAPDVVQGYPMAASRSGLLNKLTSKANDATQDVEQAYATHGSKQLQSQPVIDALQKNIDKVSQSGQPIPGLEDRVAAYQRVINWLKKKPSFSANDFRQTKQAWDSTVNYNRGNLGPDPAQTAAMEDAAGAVRDVIHSNIPQIAKADRTAHAWITLRDSLGRADTKQYAKDAMTGLLRRGTIPGAIGGMAAYSEGKSPFEGAVAGALIGQLTQTPAWETLSIAEKAMLINALKTQTGQQAVRGLSGLVSGGVQTALSNRTNQAQQ